MNYFYRVLDHAFPAKASVYKEFRRFGWDGVMRYLAAPISIYDWKRVSTLEVRDIHGAGLSLYLVFQNGSNNVSYFNYSQGFKDGKDAKEAAAELGYPRNHPIYFAVDFGATTDDLNGPILQYFNGVYDGMLHADGRPTHPLGVYGGYYVILHAQTKWPGVEHYWQTRAWSSGQVLPGCDGIQYKNGQTIANHNVDLNEFRIKGWWLAP